MRAGAKAKTVLLVEDESELREILAEEFEDAGYVVTQVESAEDALELLHSRRFDAVVSDLCLPGQSGFHLFSLVKKTCPVRPVFLLITGSWGITVPAEEEPPPEIEKPFLPSVLIAEVDKRLREQALR